jgi:response regulator RpfG family c-di-GMP phosphodiesterase
VADAYDAMTSNRSYREALPQEVVRGEIEKGIGTQFDPEIARFMVQMIDEDIEYKMRQQESDKKIILVVDDEPMNVRMVQFILQEESIYKIVSAATGKEALDIIATSEVDMVLLDLVLNDMEGFELYRRIREKYEIPVVLMTADKNLDTIQKAMELGIEDYVTKPFLPVVLKETVHSIVNSWK